MFRVINLMGTIFSICIWGIFAILALLVGFIVLYGMCQELGFGVVLGIFLFATIVDQIVSRKINRKWDEKWNKEAKERIEYNIKHGIHIEYNIEHGIQKPDDPISFLFLNALEKKLFVGPTALSGPSRPLLPSAHSHLSDNHIAFPNAPEKKFVGSTSSSGLPIPLLPPAHSPLMESGYCSLPPDVEEEETEKEKELKSIKKSILRHRRRH